MTKPQLLNQDRIAPEYRELHRIYRELREQKPPSATELAFPLRMIL